MNHTSDIFFLLYPYLSIRDASRLSHTNTHAHSEYTLYMKHTLTTKSKIRWMQQVFQEWKRSSRDDWKKMPRSPYNNSWVKRVKDPEQPILLF